MSDIKIDKIIYTRFLNNIKKFLESIKDDTLSIDMQEEKINLLKDINREEDIMILMEQAKIFYDFYMANKDKDQKSSGMMYYKYKETRETLQKLREER